MNKTVNNISFYDKQNFLVYQITNSYRINCFVDYLLIQSLFDLY